MTTASRTPAITLTVVSVIAVEYRTFHLAGATGVTVEDRLSGGNPSLFTCRAVTHVFLP